jgi:hypothetical protein
MPTLSVDRFTTQWAQTEAGSWFLGLWTADGYLSRDASMSLALKGTLYQLTLTGSNAAALASLLYAGSTFALPRKRAAAMLAIDGDATYERE